MGWASKLGRARISASAPQAAGQCDRCGFIFTHSTLKFQMDYAGAGLINKNMLVCDRCLDVPQDQLRSIVIPADPLPINNPRPANFEAQRTDKRITIGPTTTDPRTSLQTRSGDTRTSEDNDTRIVEKNGDDMLKPKVIVRNRITSRLDRRTTQNSDGRITQPAPDVPLPPIPKDK